VSQKKQQASADIADLIRQAQKLVDKAEDIAREAGVGFYMDLGDYGMGGYYDPEEGWQASSMSC